MPRNKKKPNQNKDAAGGAASSASPAAKPVAAPSPADAKKAEKPTPASPAKEAKAAPSPAKESKTAPAEPKGADYVRGLLDQLKKSIDDVEARMKAAGVDDPTEIDEPELTRATLPDDVNAKIQKLSADGEKLMDERKYPEAIEAFTAALKLIPGKPWLWRACTWLSASIGDAFFLSKKYKDAEDCFSFAVYCPVGYDNPFIHMRIGECMCERGATKSGIEEIAIAIQNGDRDIMSNEDPKYLQLIAKQSGGGGGQGGRGRRKGRR